MTGNKTGCARPFVKWAGGKRALIPEIVKVMPEQFGDYYEPFCGGAALFFGLGSRVQKACLSMVLQCSDVEEAIEQIEAVQEENKERDLSDPDEEYHAEDRMDSALCALGEVLDKFKEQRDDLDASFQKFKGIANG